MHCVWNCHLTWQLCLKSYLSVFKCIVLNLFRTTLHSITLKKNVPYIQSISIFIINCCIERSICNEMVIYWSKVSKKFPLLFKRIINHSLEVKRWLIYLLSLIKKMYFFVNTLWHLAIFVNIFVFLQFWGEKLIFWKLLFLCFLAVAKLKESNLHKLNFTHSEPCKRRQSNCKFSRSVNKVMSVKFFGQKLKVVNWRHF